MALIKCIECGREVSDKAAACIHCGCPISVSVQSSGKPAGEPVSNTPRILTLDFHAVLYGTDEGSTSQKVFVEKLGRDVEFTIRNNTQIGETIKINLREGSGYDYILFNATSVSRHLHKPADTQSAAVAANTNVNNVIDQMFAPANQNIPTVSVEAKLMGPQTTSTMQTVFVPEFNRSVKVNIPNNVNAGQTYTVSAGSNAALNGIEQPLRVYVAKVTHMDAPQAVPQAVPQAAPQPQTSYRNTQSAAAEVSIEMEQKIKALKRRVYLVPVIRLVFSLYFILSFVGIFVMMSVFPDGGAPDLLMNLIAGGFTVGFIPIFVFVVFPCLIGRYPDPGFFKVHKFMKRLEQRKLLPKVVTEMETCDLVPFGDKMCLSNSFLMPKKKNGIIIPCDEILWVYGSYSFRRRSNYLMVGTKSCGIQNFSRIRGSKQNTEITANAAMNALQRRNPAVMIGYSREYKKQYFQNTKK